MIVLGASEGCWALVRAAPAASAPAPARAQSVEHVAWAAHALGAAVGVPLAFIVFTGEQQHTLKNSLTFELERELPHGRVWLRHEKAVSTGNIPLPHRYRREVAPPLYFAE